MITVASDYKICKEDKMHISLVWISAGAIFETSLIVRDDSMKLLLSFITDCNRCSSEIIKKTLCSLEISALLRVPPSGPWVVLWGTEQACSTRSPDPISYQRRSAGQITAPFFTSIHFLLLGPKETSHNSSTCQYFSYALSYIMDRSLNCNLNQFWKIRGNCQCFRLWGVLF